MWWLIFHWSGNPFGMAYIVEYKSAHRTRQTFAKCLQNSYLIHWNCILSEQDGKRIWNMLVHENLPLTPALMVGILLTFNLWILAHLHKITTSIACISSTLSFSMVMHASCKSVGGCPFLLCNILVNLRRLNQLKSYHWGLVCPYQTIFLQSLFS